LEYQALGKNSRDHIHKNLTLESIGKKLVHIINTL